jgi:PhzF family phenazine biosynthesis protein
MAVVSANRLAKLDYDFEKLKALMLREDLTTLQLVWREAKALFHSRNPFPVGGVVEDPATGAAAAAFGGYLRDANLIVAPADIEIRQGETMGRPSLINVHVPKTGGIVVGGSVIAI